VEIGFQPAEEERLWSDTRLRGVFDREPATGLCAKLAGGRWLETEMPISRHRGRSFDGYSLLQNAKNVNDHLQTFSDFIRSSLIFMGCSELPRMR
jgi:hypothetical protein